MMIVIHAATLIPLAPSQNWMTTEAAEISAQSVMADWYQFCADQNLYRPSHQWG